LCHASLKTEIEHLKALIERSRRKLQADFEAWWSAEQQKGNNGTAAGLIDSARQAAAMSPSATSPSGLSSPHGQAYSSGVSSSPPPSTADSRAQHNSYSGGSGGLISGSLAATQPASAMGSRSNPAVAPASSSAASYPSSSAASNAGVARLPSTGNAQADADIARFYEMRDSLMKQQQQRR
jgi:hypothetical protein